MAKAKKKAEEVQVISIHPLKIKTITATIIGDTPLLVHRFSEKLKKDFADRNAGKAVKKKSAQDPNKLYCESLYWLDKNDNEIQAGINTDKHKYWGFPASGLKQACISSCRQFENVTMAGMKGAFFILGRHIRIEGKPQIQQEQGSDGIFVRVGGKGPGTGTPDIRYRAEFPEWKAKIKIRYNSGVVSAEQVLNLLNTAGFCVGLGEDRPDKKGGSFGMFHVQ